MKFSNRQISPPTAPQRTVHPNHPMIIRFPGPNRPSPAICSAANPVEFLGIWETDKALRGILKQRGESA